jgi:hypothetical protein
VAHSRAMFACRPAAICKVSSILNEQEQEEHSTSAHDYCTNKIPQAPGGALFLHELTSSGGGSRIVLKVHRRAEAHLRAHTQSHFHANTYT